VSWNVRTIRTSPRIAYRQDHVPNAASELPLDLFGNAIIEDAILDDIGESWHLKDLYRARNLKGKSVVLEGVTLCEACQIGP
jgi:hypothetical protein